MLHGPLAQSVEQKTFNLLVDGSNPSRPTTLTSNEIHGRPIALGITGFYSHRPSSGIRWRSLESEEKVSQAVCQRAG